MNFFSTVRQCKSNVDLAIIVSSSESINAKEWSRIKRFLRSLVKVFNVEPSGTHIAFVVYGTRAQVALKFNELRGSQVTPSAVIQRINSLPRQLGLRFIDKALRLAEREVFTEASGARKNVAKVC